MKLAIFSESPADEAAIRVLADAILGRETVPVNPPDLEGRGWPSVRNLLPAVFKHLYYQSDADALIVVVDSDRDEIHHDSHENVQTPPLTCRLCELRRVATRLRAEVRAVPMRAPLRLAIGIATPAVEAWYATGLIPHVNESAWVRALQDGNFPYTQPGLKRLIYGTERPSLKLETERARAAAIRVAEDLGELEARFPNGFGPLAAELRRWV